MTAKVNVAKADSKGLPPKPTPPGADAERLVEWFAACRSASDSSTSDGPASKCRVVVAFSGGVDSSVVLAAALRGCPGNVVAMTADSPSVARWQLDLARRIAADLGAEHQIIQTREVERPEYAANDSQRCFHCKSTLYEALDRSIDRAAGSDAIVVSGTNRDDLGDYRPGIEAGRRSGVRTPLADLGIGKAAVRAIAGAWGLSNADLPASPCLSSRIAYGVPVTVERLRRIEQAEDCLRRLGLNDLRVRLHEGDLARIEVPGDRIEWLAREDQRRVLTQELLSFGFRYVTLDLQGLCSGSMNRPLVSIGRIDSHDRSVATSVPSRAEELS